MKKLFILSVSVLLAACASTQDSSTETVADASSVTTERVVYRDYDNARVFQEDNGYYRQYANGGRRTRIIRTTPIETYQSSSVIEESYPAPQEVSYAYSRRPQRIMEDDAAPREVYNRPRARRYVESAPSRPNCVRKTRNYSTAGSNSGCPDQIRETREPVEVLYKKTTYRTVFEPKTYTDVSYEKEPYRSSRSEDVVMVESPASDYAVQTTTTTTTTMIDDAEIK